MLVMSLLGLACGDGVLRVFKLDDASNKSFKFFRINLPPGLVATHTMLGSSLLMYGEEKPKESGGSKQQNKPPPEIKWEHKQVHDKRAILTLFGTRATYGSADGSSILVSCSEGTDIALWHGKTGKNLGDVDTNQLKNTMASISPNGRFIAAAAFTADVKVWEVVYSKDGSVKEVSRVMQLKGHKSAVTWLCFAPNSEQIITEQLESGTSMESKEDMELITRAFKVQKPKYSTTRSKDKRGNTRLPRMLERRLKLLFLGKLPVARTWLKVKMMKHSKGSSLMMRILKMTMKEVRNSTRKNKRRNLKMS